MARKTPGERVAEACDRWGERDIVRRCAGLLGAPPGSPVVGDGRVLAAVLGGLDDPGWLDGGKPPGHSYWARVWAARALRYVWDDSATPAVVAALGDEQWRVREMAAKVVGQRELGQAADQLVRLLSDDVARVRAAAVGALGVVGEGEHGDSVRQLTGDPESAVAAAARAALERLSRRLDRRF